MGEQALFHFPVSNMIWKTDMSVIQVVVTHPSTISFSDPKDFI